LRDAFGNELRVVAVHCASWLWVRRVAGVDIGQATAKALLDYATRAFDIGLRDGIQRYRPRSSDSTMLALMEAGDRWPGIFQRRMRAVYLAGFHLARAMQTRPESDYQAVQNNGNPVVKAG
jgi:hypothetical protein